MKNKASLKAVCRVLDGCAHTDTVVFSLIGRQHATCPWCPYREHLTGAPCAHYIDQDILRMQRILYTASLGLSDAPASGRRARATHAHFRRNRLSSTICLAQAFFNGGEECSRLWRSLTRPNTHKTNEAALDK